MSKRVYEIDGRDFTTLEEFYEVISHVLIPGAKWGRNLDSLDDILHGGFGTPEEGFILRWVNSALSRERLGYPEMARQLQGILSNCHPSNRSSVKDRVDRARRGVGPTMFDWLVQIIQDHGPGGKQQVDGIELVLD